MLQHTLSTDWRDFWAKHQANIAATLTRRMQIAEANHDHRLLELLAQEKAQLLDTKTSPLDAQHWWTPVVEWMRHHDQVSVEAVAGPQGHGWRIHDPHTGKSRYAESAAEVVEWIEANHLGHE